MAHMPLLLPHGEPFALSFVRCGIEERLRSTVFRLRSEDRQTMAESGRIADKPA